MVRYLFILTFNLLFCLGIGSISIPHDAIELASSNSGVANSKNIGINFASINNVKNSFSFSSVSWYQGVKGGNISYKWGKNHHHHINLYTLSGNDIGLWYDVPNDEPTDLFDIHHISASYGFGTSFSNKFNVGLNNSVIYNQLYLDESYGYNLDLGLSYLYNETLSFGISINQLGFENSGESFTCYPILAGIGTSIHLRSLKTQFNTDLIYDESLSNQIMLRISSVTKFPYISLITGYNHSDLKKEFSCGISFQYRKIEFDYGISFHSALGNPIILSLKYHI